MTTVEQNPLLLSDDESSTLEKTSKTINLQPFESINQSASAVTSSELRKHDLIFPEPQKKTKKGRINGHDPKRSMVLNWLKLPEVKDWIAVVPEKNNYVACKWCRTLLRAHLHDLRKHATSKKHRKHMVMYTRTERTDPGEERIDIETVDSQDLTCSMESKILINEDDELHHESSLPINSKKSQDSLIPACIGFIGAGNIAQALLSGFLSSGLVEANNVIVSAPSTVNLNKLKPLGIRTTNDNNVVVQECDTVFLAVKPPVIAEALANIEPITRTHSPLFISLVSGLSLIRLEGMLSSHSISAPRVIRLMPSTPCMVLQGSCVYSLGTNAVAGERNMIKSMLGSVGLCLEVPEYLIDAASAVASSGPAFIYTAIEALADGGVKMGLPRNVALSLAAQAVKGAATMVIETGRHPGQLKDESCCPSGTTISAVHVLEKNGFRNALISAVETATLKSKDLEQ